METLVGLYALTNHGQGIAAEFCLVRFAFHRLIHRMTLSASSSGFSLSISLVTPDQSSPVWLHQSGSSGCSRWRWRCSWPFLRCPQKSRLAGRHWSCLCPAQTWWLLLDPWPPQERGYSFLLSAFQTSGQANRVVSSICDRQVLGSGCVWEVGQGNGGSWKSSMWLFFCKICTMYLTGASI